MNRRSPLRIFPSSRAGVELAINTVVVLILGIIIVGGGIAMVWKLVDGGGDLAADVTSSQHARLAELYGDGQLVAVAPQSIEVRAGDRGSVAVGVRSILNDPETFTIQVTGTGPDGLEVPIGTQVGSWRLGYFEDLEVRPDERAEAAIAILPPENAPQGTYTFIVKIVRADQTLYDSARFFTVRVR